MKIRLKKSGLPVTVNIDCACWKKGDNIFFETHLYKVRILSSCILEQTQHDVIQRNVKDNPFM